MTWRDRLVEAMGLAFDPFRVGFAEREEEERYFGRVYVDPPAHSSLSAIDQVSLSARLDRGRHTFVFADYGQGKSATRLALEYRLRSATYGEQTLAVRYTPNVRSELQDDQPKTAEEHEEAIAAELLIDLLVQALERLQLRTNDLDTLSIEQRELLVRLCRNSPGTLRRAIDIWTKGVSGTSSPWGSVRTPVLIREREPAPRWRAWLTSLVEDARRLRPSKLGWRELAAAAQTLGFQRVFLLIDAIDEDTIDDDRHIAIVRPFVERLASFYAEGIFVKAFLPIGLEAAFTSESEFALADLTSLYELATIPKASPDLLHAIIDQRLAVAAQRDFGFKSLDWFCGPELTDEGVSIQGSLVLLAQGSPRRLITLVSEFLDFYSTGGFQNDQERLALSVEEWRHFLDRLAGRRAPSPPVQR